jgi:hypothetical protein
MNIVMKQLPHGARRLKVARFKLYIDENCLAVDPEKNYDSAVPAVRLVPARLRGNLEFLKKYGGVSAPEKSMWFLFDASAETRFRSAFELKMLGRMKNAVRLLETGAYAKGARSLRGLGFGLTPSGDDFLCGFMTGLNFMEVNLPADLSEILDAVYDNARTGNLISGTFVFCAYNGRVNEKIRNLLAALAGTGRIKLTAAAKAAFKTGHTSGADFCAGLIFGCGTGMRVRGF